MSEEVKTTGTIISAKKCWWLKINTKPVRAHALDGATFPQIIKVKYEVNGTKYTKSRILHPSHTLLSEGATVTVWYQENDPSKFKIEV